MLTPALYAATPGEETDQFNWGPLVNESLTLDDADRTMAIGPVYESVLATNGATFRAVRPFYTRTVDASGQKRIQDLLWPVGFEKQIGTMEWWRFLLAFGHRFDTSDTNRPAYRMWVVPVYFQGRDRKKQDYAAVFPFGGSIHEVLRYDEVNFVLFPLYMTGLSHSNRSLSVMWPIYSTTRGPSVDQFRVWPFYGYSHRKDEFDKKFVAWPFYTSVHYYYKKSNGDGYILWPLWGHTKLTDQETWTFVPPIFRFTRGKTDSLTYCPWPFIQIASGRTKKFYLWPLGGWKKEGPLNRWFFCWPVVFNENYHTGPMTSHAFKIIPFYIGLDQKTVESNKPPRTFRYRQVWPLSDYQRENDAWRLRLLSLWPARTPEVQRTWAPFWTLYELHGNKTDRATDFLWGWYHYDRRGTNAVRASVFPLYDYQRQGARGPEWSVLKGLAGVERNGRDKNLRLLYLFRIPLGTDDTNGPAPGVEGRNTE